MAEYSLRYVHGVIYNAAKIMLQREPNFSDEKDQAIVQAIIHLLNTCETSRHFDFGFTENYPYNPYSPGLQACLNQLNRVQKEANLNDKFSIYNFSDITHRFEILHKLFLLQYTLLKDVFSASFEDWLIALSVALFYITKKDGTLTTRLTTYQINNFEDKRKQFLDKLSFTNRYDITALSHAFDFFVLLKTVYFADLDLTVYP